MVTEFPERSSPPNRRLTSMSACARPSTRFPPASKHSRLETSAVAGEDTGDIFAAQLQMLHDPRLHAELGRRIREENQSAGYAVNRVLHNYAAALRRLDNPLLADRAEDVLDIEKQLLL